MSPGATGRLAHATVTLAASFSRWKSSALPSRFTTWSGRCSTCSYVVKRRLQSRHSRLLRIARPPRAVRESTTLIEPELHTGQIMAGRPLGASGSESGYLCESFPRLPGVRIVRIGVDHALQVFAGPVVVLQFDTAQPRPGTGPPESGPRPGTAWGPRGSPRSRLRAGPPASATRPCGGTRRAPDRCADTPSRSVLNPRRAEVFRPRCALSTATSKSACSCAEVTGGSTGSSPSASPPSTAESPRAAMRAIVCSNSRCRTSMSSRNWSTVRWNTPTSSCRFSRSFSISSILSLALPRTSNTWSDRAPSESVVERSASVIARRSAAVAESCRAERTRNSLCRS